jgi:hypothetical protein
MGFEAMAELADAHLPANPICGDISPNGQKCNRLPDHEQLGGHWFARFGQVVTSWQYSGPAQPVDTPLTPEDGEQELRSWWLNIASSEVEAVVPKAVEYGATDLRDIGRDLAAISGRTVTDEEAAELGVFFYARGKLSRWVDAVIRGDRVSDDTLHDLGVYVRMAQRIRSHGGWPGINKEDAK